MNKLLKTLAIFISIAFLIACGSDSTESNQSSLITGISPYTQSSGFGKPASEQEIKVVAEKIGTYFNGQFAGNPEALMGSQKTELAQVAPTAIAKPVYRFYNHNNSAHFYTMSEPERDYIKQTFPFFSYEGEKLYAYPDADNALSPVYRFYNKITATHFYTINEDEKNTVIANWVPSIFNFEGIAWHASKTSGNGLIPVYRFFNHHTGTHFYTADASEKDHIIESWAWFRFEGIAYYAEPAIYTGKVIDGYIRGAIVFWDCNGNSILDVGEVSTTSYAGGKYVIEDKTNLPNCHLLADVGVNAMDEDRPYATGQTYMMRAAPGQKNLITPFSTLIAGLVSSEAGLTVDAAEARLASEIGSPGKLLFDYKAATTDPRATSLGTSAKVIADSLYQTQKSALFDASLIATYNDIKTKFAESGFLANVNLGIVPFVNAYKNISDRLSLIISGNTNNRMYRNTTFTDTATNQFLDALALEANNRNAVKYGVVDWNLFSSAEKDVYIRRLNQLAGLQSDTTLQTQISNYQSKRNALFSTASAAMNASIADDTGWVSFFKNDPVASMTFGLEMVSIAFDTSLDVIAIGGARPRTVVLTPNVWNYSNAKIKKQLEHLIFLRSAIECLAATQAIADSDSNMLDKTVSLVANCGSFFADVAKDATQIAKTRRASEMASKMMTNAGVWNDVVGEEKKALLALKMYAAMVGTVHDAVGLFVKDPITTRVLAAFDLGIQNLNAAIAGMELEIAATEKSEVLVAAARLKYDQEVEKTWHEYYFTYLTLVSDYYFDVIDSTIVQPVITDITPLSATTSQVVSFNIKGKYLPLTAILAVADATCQNPVNNTVTGFTQTCTMGAAAGAKAITVKTAPGGSVIVNSRTVNVNAASVISGTFTVPANSPAGTQFTVPVGATNCTFNASGTWMYSGALTSSADGNASYPNNPSYPRLLGTVPYFALIAGTNSGYIAIGSNKTVAVTAGSTLIFQINEGAGAGDSYVDNSGSLSVSYSCSNTLITTGSLSVPANLEAGTLFTAPVGVSSCSFVATGRWSLGAGQNDTADGFGPNTSVPGILMYPGSGAALIAYKNGGYIHIGSSRTVSVNGGEQLWFMANDYTGAFGDNSGAISVSYSCSNTLITTGSLSVPANLGAGTLFTVPAGATNCTFAASGTWASNTWTGTATGIAGATNPNFTWIMASSPSFSLVGLRGSVPFYIGNGITLPVTAGESLYLLMNDAVSNFGDNSGALSVSYSCN